MGHKKIIFVLLAVLLICVGATLTFYSLFAVHSIYSLELVAEVGKGIGLSGRTDKVDFGAIPPGNSASKNIFLGHSNKKPLKVQLKIKGNISEFIDLGELKIPFYLEGNSSKTVLLIAKIPGQTTYGVYSGKLDVYFRRI